MYGFNHGLPGVVDKIIKFKGKEIEKSMMTERIKSFFEKHDDVDSIKGKISDAYIKEYGKYINIEYKSINRMITYMNLDEILCNHHKRFE